MERKRLCIENREDLVKYVEEDLMKNCKDHVDIERTKYAIYYKFTEDDYQRIKRYIKERGPIN